MQASKQKWFADVHKHTKIDKEGLMLKHIFGSHQCLCTLAVCMVLIDLLHLAHYHLHTYYYYTILYDITSIYRDKHIKRSLNILDEFACSISLSHTYTHKLISIVCSAVSLLHLFDGVLLSSTVLRHFHLFYSINQASMFVK